jgi:hypothetical protein
VAIRRAHHGNLDALIAQSSDTSGPFSFDCGSPFELEAELAKEINRRPKVIDDDSYVIHPFERHVFNLREVSSPVGLLRQRDGEPQRRSRALLEFARGIYERKSHPCSGVSSPPLANPGQRTSDPRALHHGRAAWWIT